ncbi:MAG: hypothetical protein DWQ02_06485 [Bacteroidetes bacterium]|nr:MAG: hypothetical protein DWQ02_06485 [Bacteroidota bacterium]
MTFVGQNHDFYQLKSVVFRNFFGFYVLKISVLTFCDSVVGNDFANFLKTLIICPLTAFSYFY